MKDEYDLILLELKREPEFTNKLIYHFSDSNNETILEEITKDKKLFSFARKFAILTLKDWLYQRRSPKYKHFSYNGDDEFLKKLYKTCQYQWFMLTDSPNPIPSENISSKIADIHRLKDDVFLEMLENSVGLLATFVILIKTSFSECYLRLLLEEKNNA